ncbi:MAG: response regulator transcription factor [Victivallales bacterium]|nr:response regulator transcription factor [Victivallales bacterium]
MAKEKILIVEDEEDIRELVKYNLEREGYTSLTAVETGEEALTAVKNSPPDLILLDLMLPGIDGLTVCRKLKSNDNTAHIPIIMVTAKSEEADVVVGLEMGAEDYIVKPFSTKVMLARVRSVLRRHSQEEELSPGDVIRRNNLVITPGKREVRLDNQMLDLTFTEFEILLLLARRPGWVYTRNQIVNEVKGSDYPVTERAIDVQIVGLRKKLGVYGGKIETIRGVGYRFNNEN